MNKIALTFDDGPFETDYALLEMLEAFKVPATFFLLGKQVEKYWHLAQAIGRAHAVGNHTYSHPHPSRISREDLIHEILRTEAVFEEFHVWHHPIFRPPYGVTNGLMEIWNKSGIVLLRPLVLWGSFRSSHRLQ